MLMQDQMVEISEDKGWSFLGNNIVMEELAEVHTCTDQWLKRAHQAPLS
jgi:hypothetical protein